MTTGIVEGAKFAVLAPHDDHAIGTNFMDDIDLMVANAEKYNGPAHQVTDIARGLRVEAIRLLKQSNLYVE